MKLLVISNGHGEDVIAVRVLEQLKLILPAVEIIALPIVGEGHAYQKLSIPLAGKVQNMPSGGFVYMSGEQLVADLQGGLFQLTIEQLRVINRWGKTKEPILAVGDIVPLLFALMSGAKYAFVGTAKSEYYLRDGSGQWLAQTSWLERRFGSVYLPWERWLLQKAVSVYPRDTMTCRILQQSGIDAVDLGNPMMDNLYYCDRQESESDKLNFVLLPGSRVPEAISNWQQILAAATNVIAQLEEFQLTFYVAIAPGLEIKPFIQGLSDQGWQQKDDSSTTPLSEILFSKQKAQLLLSQSNYAEYLAKGDLAIAMAGTATEQFVGLGKPAITMPGTGAQCTPAFMEAQSRLLGCSILLVQDTSSVVSAIRQLIDSPHLWPKIRANGKARMGIPGSAARIAKHLVTNLLS